MTFQLALARNVDVRPLPKPGKKMGVVELVVMEDRVYLGVDGNFLIGGSLGKQSYHQSIQRTLNNLESDKVISRDDCEEAYRILGEFKDKYLQRAKSIELDRSRKTA